MNVKNNRRRKESQEKIERTFVELLQKNELDEISVSELCKLTGLNRSTFYANYTDIYELADRIKRNLEEDLKKEYSDEWQGNRHSYNYLKLFSHIKENQTFYKTYFKLDYDNTYQSIFYDIDVLTQHYGDEYIDYRIEFFKSGITAIIKKWLYNGCVEAPEVMESILKSEYKGRGIGL